MDVEFVRSTLIRRVRPVALGSPTYPCVVDIRIRQGLIEQIAPSMQPRADETVVDADGRWAMPGLWDTHVHMHQWSQTLVRLDLSGTRDPSEVTRQVAEYIAGLAQDFAGTVFGNGHRSATWPRLGTVAELDRVSGGHPVVLVSGDGHNGWLNSRVLDLLGLPPRTGPLDENEWFRALARLRELPGADDQAERAYRIAMANAAARGVVGIVDFEFGRDYVEWPTRIARGLTQLRVRTSVYPDWLDEVIASDLRTGDPLDGTHGLVTMGPLKIISDGSLNTRTAYCCHPYAGASHMEFPHGKQNFLPVELTSLLRRATANGLHVAVHAIGDAAIKDALGAFEATGAHGSIEHAQLIMPEDARRMAALGVRASVQPAHLFDDRDVTEVCWPDRTGRSFALRSLYDAAVTLTMGSDAPVAPLDPWLAMAAAVHRSGDDRPAWHPDQALTPREALSASTGGLDALAVGNPGDIALLGTDPLGGRGDSAALAAHLRSLNVDATFVAGRATHMNL